MEKLDLNIENYNLQDLLSLFKINYSFDEEDLKKAKKTVLMTHPDKSKLDKKYFLFFSKAYKRLYFIHNFKKNQNADFNEEYEDVLKKYYETYNEHHNIKKENIEKTFDNTDFKKFNEKFNKIFEENRITNEFQEVGYDDWLKCGNNELLLEINKRNINKDEQQSLINKYKNEQKQIVKHDGIKDYESNNGYSNIVSSAPNNYGSDVFSKLQYEDLKKAHEETLIIVNEQDMRKESFNNISQLKDHRNNQDTQPLSLQQSKKLLQNKDIEADEESAHRAFYLAKEAQQANDIHNKVKKYFNLLN